MKGKSDMQTSSSIKGGITDVELTAIRDEVVPERIIELGGGVQLEDDGASGPALRAVVDEVRRLRKIILSSARQIEGGGSHEDLSRYFDSLIAEAQTIRGEGTPVSARVHVHRWVDCTRHGDNEAHELCSAPDGPPCPTPHRFIPREKYLPGGTQPYPRDDEWRYEARAIDEDRR